jgi:hypothetical protein
MAQDAVQGSAHGLKAGAGSAGSEDRIHQERESRISARAR